MSGNSIYQGQSITISCSASDTYLSTTSLTVAKPSGSATATCNQPFTDTSAAGAYSVTYTAADASGNSASTSQPFTVNQLGGPSSSTSAASEEGKTQTIATSSDAVEKITVNLNAQIAGASVTISRMEGAPASIQPVSELSAFAYQYFNITKNNFSNSHIENATIEFKVNKSWILAGNITSVYLARYENGWNKLKTELVNSTGAYNSYRAYTNAFSYFAIVVEKMAEQANTIQQNKTAKNDKVPTNIEPANNPSYNLSIITALIAVLC